MFRRRLIGLLLGASPWTSSAGAQEQPQSIVELPYERALALARQQAPDLAADSARVREAVSQVDYAALLLGAATLRPELTPSTEALR